MLDLVLNVGMLAMDAYRAISDDETDSALVSGVGLGGALAVGAGAFIGGFIDGFLSDEEDEYDSYDDEEILDLLTERLNFAEVCVSLWAHCCIADGEFTEEEDELTDKLIYSLFTDDSLFPEEITNQKVIYEALIDTFNNPLPMKVIIELAQSNAKIATNFYEEACLIFTADEEVSSNEREFLDDLAEEFNITRMDKKRIERNYLAIA